MRAKLTIRRFQDRRLENALDGSRLSFNDLAELLKSGFELKIIDANSKADLTKKTLSEMLFTFERSALETMEIADLTESLVGETNPIPKAS